MFEEKVQHCLPLLVGPQIISPVFCSYPLINDLSLSFHLMY